MKFIPKLISKKEKHENFVVVDIGLGRVNIGIFDFPSASDSLKAAEAETTEKEAAETKVVRPKFVGVGRRSFISEDTLLDATLEATDSLGAVVDRLPARGVVGVCGGELTALTTIAKYNREDPKKVIDETEINSVLGKIAEREKNGLSVFFSSITGATIDGAKVSNPVGLKGEKAEINCFVAYKPAEELALYDQIIEELEIKTVKIIPSAFALTRMLASKLASSSLMLRVGTKKSEASQIHNGHLVRVTNFDIGSSEADFYSFALEAVLEGQDPKERSLEVQLFADSDDVDLEALVKKLKETDWKKKLALGKELSIKTLSSESSFGPADLSLLALSEQELV